MLVLTRKAGESVKIGRYLVQVQASLDLTRKRGCTVAVYGPDGVLDAVLKPLADGVSFMGGSLTLGTFQAPGEARLGFDFPKDVKILRSEIC